MVSFMKQYETQTYALLRIVSGFAFLCHGATKLMNFAELPPRMAYVAMPVELVAGALIMLGLFTSPAAFLASGMAAAAYWLGHFSAESYLPIMNRGDAAVLYAFVFLYIAAKGTGIWGIGKD
jgi:putative oxidoreductase